MKLRIKGNSIRLRLLKSEVELLGKGGKIEESTHFGGLQKFSYLLQSLEGVQEISANFQDGVLVVTLPGKMAKNWAETEVVGLEQTQSTGGGQFLQILIEKDFKCLTDQSQEDQSDNFANPLEDKVVC